LWEVAAAQSIAARARKRSQALAKGARFAQKHKYTRGEAAMNCISRRWWIGLACLITALTGSVFFASAGAPELRIGIPRTFFHDLSDGLIREATEPFADALRQTTGLRGQSETGGDPMAIASDVNESKRQLAVLHSFEFARAQKKYPDLEPLVVAVRTVPDYRVHVLVRKDNTATSFTDLKGKDIAMPKRSTEYCWVYLKQMCQREGGAPPKQYCGKIVRPKDVETGLDDLVRGKYDAALVDSNGLEFYEDLKPGVYARLKVLTQSEPFPPDVVVYHKGSLPDGTLDRIRNGLSRVASTATGRDMMKLWRITSFQPPPADYAKSVAAVLDAYPVPKAQEESR
jgi:ABC-type phosphate/phosphonate transport system substrate-binding protein